MKENTIKEDKKRMNNRTFEGAIFELLLDIEKQQVDLKRRFNKLIKILGYNV